MRELDAEARRCRHCGARTVEADSGSRAGRDAALRTSARPAVYTLARPDARERSGLAYAAGYVGIFCLFRASLAAPAVEWLGAFGVNLMLLWGASGPLALALGLAAGARLDRAKELAGRPQAMAGFLVGLWGTIRFFDEAGPWLWLNLFRP